MIRSRVLPLIFLLLAGLARADDGRADKPLTVQWTPYHEAMAESRDHHKPVLLHFTASWCKWCQKMRRETYADHDVVDYLNEHFATGWVDTEKFQGLARQYEVNALPTLWFLDADGKGLTAIDGYVSAEKLMSVLRFIRTEAYKEMTFEEWTERRLDREY